MNFRHNRKHLKQIENGEWTGKIVREYATGLAYYVMTTTTPGVFLIRPMVINDSKTIDKYLLSVNFYKDDESELIKFLLLTE